MSFWGCLACSAVVSAQEPPNAEAATQPSPGQLTLRQQWMYHELRDYRRDDGTKVRTREFQWWTIVNLGLAPDWSLSLKVPVQFRRMEVESWMGGGTDREEGVGDITLLAKWRVWRNDTSALNTQRLALLGGIELRSGDNPFTSNSYDPILGAAYTQIHDRHGFNAALMWKFTTGGMRYPTFAGESKADLLSYDFAYAYRLAPASYSMDTEGAWYALLELNGLYETNGDHEIFLSPGLMYEAARWVLELSLKVPVVQEVEERPETRYVAMVGVRISL